MAARRSVIAVMGGPAVTKAMSASEIDALLDAHDVLLSACLDGGLSLQEFVAAYGQFPHGYGLDSAGAAEETHEALPSFRKRIAFHRDVAKLVASMHHGPLGDAPMDEFGGPDALGSTAGGGFMEKAVILRLRQLVARHAGFTAGA
jgi:hypothetical protein